MRYRYRAESQNNGGEAQIPSNSSKYMTIGLIAIVIIALAAYMYRKKSESSDPLNKTVKVNLAAAQIPMPPAPALLQDIASASPKVSLTRTSASGASSSTSLNGGAMELYALLTYNLPDVFKTKIFPCYEKSLTNPRLALNITKQIMRMLFVTVIDAVTSSNAIPQYRVPYPGIPTPKGFLSKEELAQFYDKVRDPEIQTSFILLPIIIQLMLENNYKSAEEVLIYTPNADPTEIGTVTIKSPILWDIIDYLSRLEMPFPDQSKKNLSVMGLDIFLSLFLPYYLIQRMRNNTYSGKCGQNIEPNLQKDIMDTVTQKSLDEMNDKGAFFR